MNETFKVGQKVVFRKDWLKGWLDLRGGEWQDSELERWVKLPYMTVTEVGSSNESYVYLDIDNGGTWTWEAITAYKEPPKLPEDLFIL